MRIMLICGRRNLIEKNAVTATPVARTFWEPENSVELSIGLFSFTMAAKYKITTFGCQMNKSDSQRLQSLLKGMGMEEAVDESSADLVVYNTCSVRQAAEDRIYGATFNAAQLKQKNPRLLIAVTGCMAGRDSDGKIRERLHEVDLFFPTDEMVYLPQRIAELRPELIETQERDASEYEHYLKIKPTYENDFQAYIAISNGCNKFCTYCVVPYARGRQKDRSVKDVIDEVRDRARHGCVEVTLLGQTVNLYMPTDRESFGENNPYRTEKNLFAALMWEINQIEGISRIHFTAPHPQYMDEATIRALTLPKQVNYLHLPVQSGSNEVLKRMNRPYSREYFIDVIQIVRDAKPDIALGTDIIVGFCGETAEQFDQTLDFYRICDFDIAYTAMYSVRSGTAAARMYKDDVPRAEKKRRWRALQQLMEETVLRKNQKFVGRTVSVLVDSYEKGLCSGNSLEMKRVCFRGEADEMGKIAAVRIDRAVEWVLYGSRNDS
jgi:tRNA-2-methylthio-N6-dimethylallyladenosine synthase